MKTKKKEPAPASDKNALPLEESLRLVVDLYERARKTGDLKTELAALQEKNKLLHVYEAPPVASPEESPAVLQARAHLEALDVAPPGLPIEELARRVANEYAKNFVK